MGRANWKDCSPLVVYKLGVLGHFVLKNKTRQIDKIHEDFWTISSIIFCAKICGYSQIIYCLQEKSTNCGLKVSVAYVVLTLFELYQVFMYNILWQIVLIFTKIIDTIWSGGIRTFCPKNLTRENYNIHKDFWTISSLYV